MKYNLFLFDLDDTLLDFKASERLSFKSMLQSFSLLENFDSIFEKYQIENKKLWTQFEQGKISKDFVVLERFRITFEFFKLDIDIKLARDRYQDALPESVVLIDHAEDICKWLSSLGEIGIITNGVHKTQIQRIKKSRLEPYIKFITVSEECGFAKPDIRFFQHSIKNASRFTKEKTIVIGDRIDTDVLGAHNFGVDSCWYNPEGFLHTLPLKPTFEIKHLSDIKKLNRI